LNGHARALSCHSPPQEGDAPSKHGYVRDPLAWPWSSVHRHLRLGWLAPDWTGWTPIEVPIELDP
jgi:hypothetical protein